MLLPTRDSDNLLSVGRKALDRVNDDDRRRDFPDRREVAADEDLVDDLADDPGGKRGRERDQAHHRKGEDIALPVLEPWSVSSRRRIAFEGELKMEPTRLRASRQTDNVSIPREGLIAGPFRVRRRRTKPRPPYHRRSPYGNNPAASPTSAFFMPIFVSVRAA